MIRVGDKVWIGESGASIFVVREIDPEDGRAVIEPEDSSMPGAYPFSMPVSVWTQIE
ncbi:hypothetical protein ACIBEK_12035 [Nocardia fusca]|uniref:hypothetical protein n=1 Tax=Nocardia fusca TaxID=941183 RepID=UPI0037A8352C